jgi:membrane protease subunit (stomatin/prohibitin family)
LLTSFQIGAITPPEEVQKAIDQRGAMGAIGNMTAYTQYQAAQAMREAAQNPGGAGDTAATGVGLGAGVALGQTMAQAMTGAMAGGQQPATPAAPNTAEILVQIEKLNELHKAGALTDEEFAAMKAKLLG